MGLPARRVDIWGVLRTRIDMMKNRISSRFSFRMPYVVALMFVAIFSAATHAAVSPKQINKAIERATKFIYSKQLPAGRWETDPERIGTDHESWSKMQGDTYGGYTALSTYALLAAGESPNDPRIKAAVAFLKRCDMVGVYAIAMRLQVWLLIPHDTPEMKALIHKDADFLMNNVNIKADVKGTNNGLWDYLGKGPRIDHSVSQYGVLGLWAAQQSGVVDVGTQRWKLYEGAWRRDQKEDGGWGYQDDSPTASMTAAGVATLFITADYLHAEEGVVCTGTLVNPWIDRGLAWMDRNYSSIGDSTYAMYGIERIGAASGYKFFGAHDWFTDIAERLVKTQRKDGSWSSYFPGAGALDATAFALLFLARGQAPVLMNKLDYHLHALPPGKAPTPETHPTTGPGSVVVAVNWDERPRDLSNLANFVGHQTETFRNWQIVTLQALPEDLHDAPVLYMSGNDAIDLTPDDVKRLKLFIQQGGMVLGNADCGREEFVESFKALGKAMFGGTFRELPLQHPAYTHEQFQARRWRTHPSVLGLTNGVRELMVLIPSADLARWWQNPNGAAGHEEAFELGTDLYEYACDRQLWNKGDSYIVRLNPEIHAAHKVKIARLVAGPNWDPEPGGWSRLAAVMHNEDSTDLIVYPATPGQGALTAAHIVHLTGTTPFSLSNGARLELKSFVEHGGTLVVDAAGGSLPFADAAEQEMKAIFGQAAVRDLDTSLPPNHAVFRLRSHPIDTFTYRAWARQNSVGALKQPRIKGITVGDRVAVFLSRDDLSAGLVGEPVDGIIGYSPETATAIMRNIILYATSGPTKSNPAAR
jgi:hypothetical protein